MADFRIERSWSPRIHRSCSPQRPTPCRSMPLPAPAGATTAGAPAQDASLAARRRVKRGGSRCSLQEVHRGGVAHGKRETSCSVPQVGNPGSPLQLTLSRERRPSSNSEQSSSISGELPSGRHPRPRAGHGPLEPPHRIHTHTHTSHTTGRGLNTHTHVHFPQAFGATASTGGQLSTHKQTHKMKTPRRSPAVERPRSDDRPSV